MCIYLSVMQSVWSQRFLAPALPCLLQLLMVVCVCVSMSASVCLIHVPSPPEPSFSSDLDVTYHISAVRPFVMFQLPAIACKFTTVLTLCISSLLCLCVCVPGSSRCLRAHCSPWPRSSSNLCCACVCVPGSSRCLRAHCSLWPKSSSHLCCACACVCVFQVPAVA